MKQSLDDLAIFGGKKLFSSPRPIGQLYTPDIDLFLELVKQAIDARYLTNSGPIVRRLESTLADLHGVKHCVTVANAGLGITMLMRLFAKGRRGEVIMPAFSFRGLPHFAQWAGQTPRFCDVDSHSHTLNPEAVISAIDESTTSILSVANFNGAGNIDELSNIARRHSIPLFIDSVYAMGTTNKQRPMGAFAQAEVFSLHATKLLNGFEGGYITTNDGELADLLRWQQNFSLPRLRPDAATGADHVIGINAKLNEIHAAMALLSVENMDVIIADNKMRYEEYARGLHELEGLALVPYSTGEQNNFQMAIAEVMDSWPLDRNSTVSLLKAEGAAISPYYSPPLHLSEHCPDHVNIPSLPVSENLAEKYLQLPVGYLVSLDDIRALCELLRFIQENGQRITKHLKTVKRNEIKS
jgi:dTDP-4-amino-4,6-dideoxyglucose